MAGLFDDIDPTINERTSQNFLPDCEHSCFRCQRCNSPKLSLIAKKPGGIMFIAGEPTQSQDRARTVWTGSYKNILLPLLEKNRYDMDKVSFAFAAACHGPKLQDMKPRDSQLVLDSCSSTLWSTIGKAQPQILIPMDSFAWETLTGKYLTGRIKSATFTDDYVYHLIPDQQLNYWLAPIISPVELTAMMNDRRKQDDYTFYARRTKKFLREVCKHKEPLPSINTNVTIIDDLERAKFALKDILENQRPPYLAFDFETDALKIERTDLDIVCVGIAYFNTAISMPFYEDDEFRSLFKNIMDKATIGKIAHHAKYESRCCLDKLGSCPEPWAWDSMYGARILYNKVKCGLKPQTYLNFGVAGYDTVEALFEPISKEEEDKYGNNAHNKLRNAFENDPSVRKKTLTYVAQDAKFTLMLALKQMQEFAEDEHLQKGEKLFRSFINPLVRAEVNGMVVDKIQVRENIEECDRILAEAEKVISEDPDLIKHWNNAKEGHAFDYNKNSDLGHFLYDLMGLSKEYTEKGEYALDATTLERMPLPITDAILEARRITKIRDTYLINLKKEAVKAPNREYVLHSSYNLHVADTFRSSSSGGLNLQNVPSHDKRANNLIRSCIVPPKGTCIVGIDYRALEVTIGCSIHHDKNMLSFLESGGDMHRATMKDIFLLSDEEADSMDKGLYKALRASAKQCNFSAFYGGGFNSIGNTRWKDINHNPAVFDHIKKKGIGEYDPFMAHMKEVLDRLWTVQFPQYGQWRKDTYEFYQNHGYVDLVDGFRCYGPLSSMQATNAPIQGPASHVLLWAFSHIDEELRQKHMRSFLINEIHDACYGAVYEDELDAYLKLARKWMIEEAPNQFPWISSPLAAEAERTAYREEDGNWAQEIEIGMI